METETVKEQTVARGSDLDASKEEITAYVRHYCKHHNLSHNQTRAAVTAALNHYAQDAAKLRHAETEGDLRCPLPVVRERLEMRAISHGRHVAGQFAEANGHG